MFCVADGKRDELVCRLLQHVQDYWQRELERQIIPAPQFYQLHAFVTKQKGDGRCVVRALVVSNSHISNVHVKGKHELRRCSVCNSLTVFAWFVFFIKGCN
jgi:hypothetical protein